MRATVRGRTYVGADVRRYFGDPSQLCGVRRFVLEEGRSQGSHILQVNNGAGLILEVNSSRGMDLGRLALHGVPISYQSYNQEVAPDYYEAYEDGWLRSYGGGLLVTGGLTSTGSPERDGGEILPLHGRVSNIPATAVSYGMTEHDGRECIFVSGDVRESKALRCNLVLHRKIFIDVGRNEIKVDDTVENEGFEESELMILYHFNFGHPLLDAGAQFVGRSCSVEPRDRDAAACLEPYWCYLAPTPHYKDIVYYHQLADQRGVCTAGIANEGIGLAVGIRFLRNELDCLTQWKFLGEGNYVAGIEPGNAFVSGRSAERTAGRMKTIGPQERRHFGVRLRIYDDPDEVRQFISDTVQVEERSHEAL